MPVINICSSHVILLNINIPLITENYERHHSRHQKCQDESTAQICNERFANVRIFGSFTEKCLFCDKHFKLIQFPSWKSIILKKEKKHQKKLAVKKKLEKLVVKHKVQIFWEGYRKFEKNLDLHKIHKMTIRIVLYEKGCHFEWNCCDFVICSNLQNSHSLLSLRKITWSRSQLNFKKMWENFSNFVAFSQNLNFKEKKNDIQCMLYIVRKYCTYHIV